MRILQTITRADSIGGAQTHFLHLARRLQRDGDEVLVVTGPGELLGREIRKAGLEWIVCPTLRKPIHPLDDLRTLHFYERVIQRFRPDLVSCHSAKAGMLGRLAARRQGVPSVFTAHGWAFTEGIAEPARSIYQQLEKTVAKRTTRIICCCETDRELAIRVGIAPQRLTTVHYGIEDVPQALRANPGDDRGSVKIIMIARFFEQKDHATLFEAFRGMENAELLLVGEGPLFERTVDLAKRLGISARVHFLGHRFDIAELLAQAHIYTLPSNWEGFPIATLEAMRAGLPVVVSRVGGAAEAVDEGVSGYCFDRGDAATLRKRLVTLAADAQLRRRMGEAGRQRFEQEFTMEQMYVRTRAVYAEALRAARGDLGSLAIGSRGHSLE